MGERLLAYPDIDGVDDIPAAGLEVVLPPLIQAAIEKRELSRRTDPQQVPLTSAAIFVGTALVIATARSRIGRACLSRAAGAVVARNWRVRAGCRDEIRP